MSGNGKIVMPIGLVVVLLSTVLGYGKLQGQVTSNKENIGDLKEAPMKIVRVEQKVEDLSENFKEFRTEQKSFNGKMYNKLDEVLRAVK